MAIQKNEETGKFYWTVSGVNVDGKKYTLGQFSKATDLEVERYLDLRGTSITSLPEGLKVGGCLYLRGTKITSLPEGLKVGGHLDLSDTPITSLPEGLKVGGSLYLSDTPLAKKWKDSMTPDGVKGEVYV